MKHGQGRGAHCKEERIVKIVKTPIAIVVLPGTGVFLLPRNSAPLPLDWLRIHLTGGASASASRLKIAKGSYIRDITKCLYFAYPPPPDAAGPATRIIGKHHADTAEHTPFIVSDVWTNDTTKIPTGFDTDELIDVRRNSFRKALADASSNKLGCRQYVNGALYQHVQCPHNAPDVYIHGFTDRDIADADYVLQVGDDGNCFNGSSIVRVRMCSDKNVLDAIRRVTTKIATMPGNARDKLADKGTMFGIGQRIHNGKLGDYVATNTLNLVPGSKEEEDNAIAVR